jgi:hypothetical protein
MTNATLPTVYNVPLLGGLLKMFVDQINSLFLSTNTAGKSGAGTSYTQIKNNKTGASYGAVPASTNLRCWGFDSITLSNGSGTNGLAQFGYADDSAGTNFVSLFDCGVIFGLNVGTLTNQLTGLLTVPTGKYPLLKSTNSNGGGGTVTFNANMTMLETV